MTSLFQCAVMAGLLFSTPAFAEPPPLIPINDLAADPTFTSPILSPDGKLIVAKNNAGNSSGLAIIDADKPTSEPIYVTLGRDLAPDIRWAGNRKLLFNSVLHFSVGYTTILMSRLMLYDIDSKKLTNLGEKSKTPVAGQIVYVDPAGAWALVASPEKENSSAPSVKRLDLSTGEAVLVERAIPDVSQWFADTKGVVRGGIAYEKRGWTIWYRDKAGEPLQPIRGKFPADDSAVDTISFSQMGGTGFMVTNQKTGRFGVYKYDLKIGGTGEAIFEHPQVDVGAVALDPENGEVQGVLYEDDRWRTVWFDPELKALQAKLDQALPNLSNLVQSASLDKNRVLVLSSGASDPGAYYLLDRKSARMHPVIEMYDRIDPETLAPVEQVRYSARDGLGINAYLTLPRGRDPNRLPLIVMPHGGPAARDHWSYDPILQFLANRGYAVLQPQFRGSTGYGKQFIKLGDGQIGAKMQDDLDDGVDWLVRSGKVDPKRVCLFGMSYGGYAAMWGAIRNPERYRCAASFAGPSDLKAQLRDNRKLFSAPRYFKEWQAKFTGQDKIDLSRVSPLAYAANLKVPLLIAHGEQDPIVLSRQSHTMIRALRAAGKDVTSVFYKDGMHDLRSADFGDFLKRLEVFLAKNNPAR